MSWPGDLLCRRAGVGTVVLAFLAAASFAPPCEPWDKLERPHRSARQSAAGRNELDAGKPRPMLPSEEEPAGYWPPGSGPISTRSKPGRPGSDTTDQPPARRFTHSVATEKAELRLGLPTITADILHRCARGRLLSVMVFPSGHVLSWLGSRAAVGLG